MEESLKTAHSGKGEGESSASFEQHDGDTIDETEASAEEEKNKWDPESVFPFRIFSKSIVGNANFQFGGRLSLVLDGY